MPKNDNKLKGVGGWLLFLIFSLWISVPLNLYFGIKDIVDTLTTTDLSLGIAYFLVLSSFVYYGAIIWLLIRSAYSLNKIKVNAIFTTKKYLIIILISNLIQLAFILLTGEDLNFEGKFADGTMTIRSILSSIIWLAYLDVSIRINNTYPESKRKEENIDKLLFAIALGIAIYIYAIATFGFIAG